MNLKSIKGFEDYQISDDGKVYSLKTKKYLKPICRNKYLNVYLYKNKKRHFALIHRLVALNFIDNPNHYPQINHKDENPQNNKVENLERCTNKYNANYGHHSEKIKKFMTENNPFKGKHHTKESREKMRNAKLGKPSKRKRKITINGVEYESIEKAMQELKISTRKLYKLIEENK